MEKSRRTAGFHRREQNNCSEAINAVALYAAIRIVDVDLSGQSPRSIEIAKSVKSDYPEIPAHSRRVLRQDLPTKIVSDKKSLRSRKLPQLANACPFGFTAESSRATVSPPSWHHHPRKKM